VLALGAACTFRFERELGSGQLRGTLEFEAADGSRTPAAGAEVSLVGAPLRVKADARGRFVLRGLPGGTYGLRVRYRPETGDESALVLHRVELAAGDGRDLGRIAMGALGAVEGAVVGAPAAEVSLARTAQVRASGGRFSFPRLAPGDYELGVTVPVEGRPTLFSGGSVRVQPRKTEQVSLDLASLAVAGAGRLALHVRMASGGDPTQAEVRIAGGAQPVVMHPDADGSASRPDVPPGVYTIAVSGPGLVSVQVPLVVVSGDVLLEDVLMVPLDCAGGDADPQCAQVDRSDDDADGAPNAADNCPSDANADQADADDNGIGDACEPRPPDFEPPAAPAFDAGPRVVGAANEYDVTGLAEAGSTVRLFAGDACAGDAMLVSTASDGHFLFRVTVGDDSVNVFTANATDPSGNVSACSQPFTYECDSSRPDASGAVVTIDARNGWIRSLSEVAFSWSGFVGATRHESSIGLDPSCLGEILAAHAVDASPRTETGVGLVEGRPYTVCVRAGDAFGAPSDWVASAPFEADVTPPGAPAVAVDSRDDGGVTLSAPAPGDASGADPAAWDVAWCSPAPCAFPDPSQIRGVSLPVRAAPEGGCGERVFGVRAHDVAGNTGAWGTIDATPCGPASWCFDPAGACTPKCAESSCGSSEYCDPYTSGPIPICVSRCESLVQPAPVPPAVELPPPCAAGHACEPEMGECVVWCEDSLCGGEYAFVASPPVAVIVRTLGEGALALNTAVAAPPVQVAVPGKGGGGGLALNPAVASPPVVVVLPVEGEASGFAPNTTVSAPQVQVAVPGKGGGGGLSMNPSVASPPAQVVVPASGSAAGLPANTTVARPPAQLVVPLIDSSTDHPFGPTVAEPPVAVEYQQ